MKYVKITHGYYGAREGNIIKVKGKNDKPFPLPDEEADRIVGLGIAEYVGEAVPAQTADIVSQDTEENGIPEYDNSTGMAELKEIAKREGIVVPFGISKKDLKTLLDEHFADEDELDDMPDLTAEEPR